MSQLSHDVELVLDHILIHVLHPSHHPCKASTWCAERVFVSARIIHPQPGVVFISDTRFPAVHQGHEWVRFASPWCRLCGYRRWIFWPCSLKIWWLEELEDGLLQLERGRRR